MGAFHLENLFPFLLTVGQLEIYIIISKYQCNPIDF